MNYLSVKDAAKKWGVTMRTVQYFCANGKITGALRIGKQWLIPADIQRPGDGRTKRIRNNPADKQYRFPVFLFSSAFTNRESLNYSEKMLLSAQIMYLEGHFSESIKTCYTLLDSAVTDSLQFGAYITIAYDSMVLGLHKQYRIALHKAEKIGMRQSTHKEDYALVLAGITYYVRWDFKPLLEIDISRISGDALLYYQSLLILQSTFSSVKESPYAIPTYAVLCRSAELDGILPCSMMLHLMMATFYTRDEQESLAEFHAQAGCKIAIENGWIWYLSKYYYSVSRLIDKYAVENERSFLPQILEYVRNNVRNIKLIQQGEQMDLQPEEFYTTDNNEILHLMAYGMALAEIASVLHLSQKEVSQKAKSMCVSFGLSGTKALRKYAERTISMTATEDSDSYPYYSISNSTGQ